MGKQSVNRLANTSVQRQTAPVLYAPPFIPNVLRVEPQSAFTITADSQPDIDNWGPDSYWSCQDYITWHKLNVQAYGVDTANQKFVAAWQKLDAFDADYNWCKYESYFVDYFEGYGLKVGNILSSIWLSIGNIGSAVGNTTEGIKNLTEILKWLLPIVLLIGLTIVSIWAFKKYAQ